ncbi:MAG: ATP-dependent DNA helicase RecG [Prevotellaceae bacterium]|jgi:ATP-dependent DNA helicase RecG|nr:ATP-dependent DNA helicase RecG [Prevotellaceae bacterium]
MLENIIPDIKFLAGVGPKRAELLKKELEVVSADDLIRCYPYRYVDRSRFYYIHEISSDVPFIQIKGQITRFEKHGEGHTQRLVAHFTDGRSTIELVWFRGIKFVQEKLKTRTDYIVFGRPSLFNGHWNIPHPDIDSPDDLPPAEQMGLQPYYNTTEKMKHNFLNSKALQKIMANLLLQIKDLEIEETLTPEIIKKYSLMGLKNALFNIHFPLNADKLNHARQRLKFEELFFVQLHILHQTKLREQNVKGFIFNKIGSLFNDYYKKYLPFELTNAQKRVLKEIRADVGSGRQMNRLLQGDVGSGKTIVALFAMLIALDNGFQAAIMTPTEILSQQHYDTISTLLERMNVNIALLTGSTKAKEREPLHEKLQSGDIHILIGTHALIEETVKFKNLGLVVIDEQHRFGVAQRARLWQKNTQPPHILVMTATPIPRTLAMTLYGDLKISVIDELPPGRKPVQTYHYFMNKRQALNKFLAKQIDEGRQIYIVYPLIKESEKLDLQDLEAGYRYICEVFPQYKAEKVHGQMKPKEKDHAMQRFVSGEVKILVATTVIEVGVNVPNASVMVIENAERFGLSQLHQLRGRVGRGADQSYCILLTSYKLGADTRKRLEIMTETNDGFRIAEADLQLRGPGDMDGTAQSGMPFDLKIANIAQDGRMLEIARKVAAEILAKDPALLAEKNFILKNQLKKLRKEPVNWGLIS